MHLLKTFGLKKDPEICNLECKTGKKTDNKKEKKTKTDKLEEGKIFDIQGPVKVVLIDPPDEDDSERRRTAAGFIALANMMIAANTTIVILYSLSFNFDKYINIHIMLCTIAYQFIFPLSILMMNPLYGPAMPLDDSGRIRGHAKFMLIAVICSIPGAYFGYKNAKMKPTPTILNKLAKLLPFAMYHYLAGVAAKACFGLLAVFVVIVFIQSKVKFLKEPQRPSFCSLHTWLQYCHKYIALLTLVLSNLCYVTGIITPPMQIIFYFHGFLVPTIAILFFTLCYTLILIVFSSWHYSD